MKNISEIPSENQTIITAALQAILENTKDMMFVKDANLVYVAASMPFVQMVGKESVDEIVNRTDMEIFEDYHLAKRYVSDDHKLMEQGNDLIDYIEPITDDNGHARYGSTSKYLLTDKDGSFIGILGITRDITRDYIARQHYQHELRYLFELPKDVYAVTYIDVDSWRIISQRKQKIDNAGYQTCYTVEWLCKAALESIVDDESDAANFYRNFTCAYLRDIYSGGKVDLSFEYQRYLSDDSTRWVRNDIKFLVDVNSGHLCVMLTARDIDGKKKEEQKLKLAATMDKMTMVLNRETTMEYIRQALREEESKRHVLFMIDVDNFKKLNDTLGHRVGDEFLIAFAAELQRNFRETDIVGRIGGDEFFALMRNVSGLLETEKKAGEILGVIQRVCSNYESVGLSGSIGISLYPDNGATLEELYVKADSALYQAKRQGKNQVVFAME